MVSAATDGEGLTRDWSDAVAALTGSGEAADGDIGCPLVALAETGGTGAELGTSGELDEMGGVAVARGGVITWLAVSAVAPVGCACTRACALHSALDIWSSTYSAMVSSKLAS